VYNHHPSSSWTCDSLATPVQRRLRVTTPACHTRTSSHARADRGGARERRGSLSGISVDISDCATALIRCRRRTETIRPVRARKQNETEQRSSFAFFMATNRHGVKSPTNRYRYDWQMRGPTFDSRTLQSSLSFVCCSVSHFLSFLFFLLLFSLL